MLAVLGVFLYKMFFIHAYLYSWQNNFFIYETILKDYYFLVTIFKNIISLNNSF